MSYSFNVKAATKADLESQIAGELGKVVEQQPIHNKDIGQALAASKSLLSLVDDDSQRDLTASVSGSIWVTESDQVEHLSLSVNIGRANREPVAEPADAPAPQAEEPKAE